MSYYGSGVLSKTLARDLWCENCNLDFSEDVFFDDGGVCDERYPCPKCFEFVYYYEDLREEKYDG